MQYTTLGATGLKVSVAGLGCGGNSRVGLGTGSSESQSVDLVREAIDLGVNLLDTAEIYCTEEIVGKAIAGLPRDKIVISTKSRYRDASGCLMSGRELVANLDASLKRLRTGYVDIFHVHGLSPAAYDHAMAEIVPALLKQKAKGKLRHLAVSETSPNDHEQRMLQRAVRDGVWEVVMLAFHMLHQGARRDVFPHTRGMGIGTLLMFVVRNIFSKPGLLAETVRGLAAEGKVPVELAKSEDPLGFLVHEGGATNLTDAAYRFARHQSGANVVLFGTGRREHLRANIDSILRPPLPAADVARLHELFGALKGVGLDLPDRIKQ
jgi:aryl-alcohol dehydrogenase-like predicted oxidoreductase